MTLALGPEEATLLLLFARLGTMVMLMPMLGDEVVPRQLRLLFALGLTVAMAGLLRPYVGDAASPYSRGFALLVLREALVGLAMGMLARLYFQAAVMAGAIVSLQMGLTTALVFDPALGGQTPLTGKLIALAASLACFAAGLHQWWFAGLVHSYAVFPPGGGFDAAGWSALAIAAAGEATRVAVSLAAPFLVFGILFNVALGIANRLAPAIQLFFIAQPLLIAGGIALLAVTIGPMIEAFSAGYRGWLLGGWAHG